MVQVNPQAREIALKVVYYGPALSGKTTNLQALFQRIEPAARGRLMTLDTKDDRTLFFDLLPLTFRTPSPASVKLRIFSVPGQAMHESTRRIVLQGTDAVVFVADSRAAEDGTMRASWKEMLVNLAANGIDASDVPIVVQLNKSDLPGARRPSEIAELAGDVRPAFVPAVAIRGAGVVETLHALLGLAFRRVDRLLGVERAWRLDEAEFLDGIFSHVDLHGTALGAAGGTR